MMEPALQSLLEAPSEVELTWVHGLPAEFGDDVMTKLNGAAEQRVRLPTNPLVGGHPTHDFRHAASAPSVPHRGVADSVDESGRFAFEHTAHLVPDQRLALPGQDAVGRWVVDPGTAPGLLHSEAVEEQLACERSRLVGEILFRDQLVADVPHTG